MNAASISPYRLNFQAVRKKDGLLYLQWDGPDNGPTPDTFDNSLRQATGSSKIALEAVHASMPTAQAYLEARRKQFLWSGTVLEFGQEFLADEGEPWQCRLPWRCYENAYNLAEGSGGRVHYVEGICLSPFGGMLHAWGVCDGKVLDYTWPAPHFNRYFGVVFDIEFLKEQGLHGGVFCRWDPVLKYLSAKKAPR